jgi:hypothetical protein
MKLLKCLFLFALLLQANNLFPMNACLEYLNSCIQETGSLFNKSLDSASKAVKAHPCLFGGLWAGVAVVLYGHIVYRLYKNYTKKSAPIVVAVK